MKRFIFLMLMGLSFNSFAHDWSDQLGASASATDYISISCTIDGSLVPDKLFFQIISNSSTGTPLVSAQIAKGLYVTNVTDLISGDAISSRFAEIKGGDGAYRITVNKNGTGAIAYSFVYHCENANGEHTDTDLTMIKNN